MAQSAHPIEVFKKKKLEKRQPVDGQEWTTMQCKVRSHGKHEIELTMGLLLTG